MVQIDHLAWELMLAHGPKNACHIKPLCLVFGSYNITSLELGTLLHTKLIIALTTTTTRELECRGWGEKNEKTCTVIGLKCVYILMEGGGKERQQAARDQLGYTNNWKLNLHYFPCPCQMTMFSQTPALSHSHRKRDPYAVASLSHLLFSCGQAQNCHQGQESNQMGPEKKKWHEYHLHSNHVQVYIHLDYNT